MAFIILGHGFETPVSYETRETMPANTYLVTLRECGIQATSDEDMNPLIRAMLETSDPALFNNPVANRLRIESMIGKGIRVYGPGDRYPMLRTSLFTNAKLGEKQFILAKSGVYKLPLRKDQFEIWPTDIPLPPDESRYMTPLNVRFNGRYFINDNGAFQKAFAGSLMPVETDPILQKPSLARHEFGDSLRPYVKDIFAAFGPGVYYYPICRSIPQPTTEYAEGGLFEFISTLATPDEQEQIEQIRKERESGLDTVKTMQKLYPFFERYKDKNEEATRLFNEIKGIAEEVPKIRSRSTERQRRAGRRRRHRTKRQRKRR